MTFQRLAVCLGAGCTSIPRNWYYFSCPSARSPKAMRCTEAAMVRASSGAVSRRGIIPGDHGSLHVSFQVAQPAERADHPPADFLYHLCYIGIAGRLAREKAGFAPFVGAIEVDPLYEDAMEMEVHIERAA